MFSVVPMMRLQAVVLAQDERAVLKGLGRLGAVHLTRAQSGPETAPLAPADHTGELARYDRIRARVQEFRQSLEIPPLSKEQQLSFSSHSAREEETGGHPSVDNEYPALRLAGGALLQKGTALSRGQVQTPEIATITLDQAEESLRSLEQQSKELLEHRQRLIHRQKELAGICEQVSCYRGLDIPLDGLDQYSFLHFITGSLPAQNFESLAKEIGDNVALLPLTQQKGQLSIFSITTPQGRPALERALQQAGFQREVLPVVENTTVDRLSEDGEKEQEQLAAELEQLKGRITRIAAEFALPMAEIEGFANMETQLLDASQKFPRTEATVLIAGWIPASDVSTMEKHIGEITGGRYVLQTTPPDVSTEEQIPVLLRHPRLLRPFGMLVETYGLPNYREFEPTLFVALSYIVMFGMMFGDAGHGAVLAVCGLIALLACRSRKARDMGVLLLFGGFSSIIFGVVYGSYFGIEVFKKYALWHDPLEGDPMQLMYGAIGIGIAMISLGLILNVINRFRRGDVIGGILDKFGLIGLLFYWGTLILLINKSAIQSRGLMIISIILFLIVPIVGWSLKEPLEHLLSHKAGEHDGANGGLAEALIESCVGAFEAILSYLANTISFVRLAAYAMSHAALLFAAFMLAEEVRHFPFGGSYWSLLIIILGNIIAIVLEGVIASVQALRLEYYEFFGKFFSGSGQPFKPFRLAPDGKDSAL
jgi:V/A-type H+-transporting ATPase subunit I